MNDSMIVSGQQKGCAHSVKIIPHYLSDRCNKNGIGEKMIWDFIIVVIGQPQGYAPT